MLSQSLFNTAPRLSLAACYGKREVLLDRSATAVCVCVWLTGLSPQPPGSHWLYHSNSCAVNHSKSSKPLAPAACLSTKMNTLAHFYDGWGWFVLKEIALGISKAHSACNYHPPPEGKTWSEMLVLVKRLNNQGNFLPSYFSAHLPVTSMCNEVMTC